MSERYMQIGSTTCTLLVMVLAISVWEMSVPTEGTTGEYIKNKSQISLTPKSSVSLTDKIRVIKNCNA